MKKLLLLAFIFTACSNEEIIEEIQQEVIETVELETTRVQPNYHYNLYDSDKNYMWQLVFHHEFLGFEKDKDVSCNTMAEDVTQWFKFKWAQENYGDTLIIWTRPEYPIQEDVCTFTRNEWYIPHLVNDTIYLYSPNETFFIR